MIKIIFFVHIRSAALIHSGILVWLSDLLCFSMAWFFFKSGMFHKEMPFRERVRKDAKALLVPYLSFTLFTLLLYLGYEAGIKGESLTGLLRKSAEDLLLEEALQWNLALWFLPTLFAVKAIANLTVKRIGSLFLLLVSLTAAFLLCHFRISHPVYLGNIALGLTFYASGILLKDFQFRRTVSILAILLYMAGFVFKVCTELNFRCNYIGETDNYFVNVLYVLAGVIAINNLFKLFANKKLPILFSFGMLSLVPFCIHYPFTQLIPRFLNHLPFSVSPTLSWIIQSLFMIPLFWWAIRFFNGKGHRFIGK